MDESTNAKLVKRIEQLESQVAAMTTVHLQKLPVVEEAISHFSMQLVVQSLAIQAIARTLPSPEEVARVFRSDVEMLLAEYDDDPMKKHAHDALLLETNAFLAALQRKVPGESQDPI